MYIFLDVDGVLNTESDWAKKVYSLNQKCVNQFCGLIDVIKNPKVVLTSTWRNGIARDGTTAVHIEDLLEALKPAGIISLDRTGFSPDGSRSREIEHYLKRHVSDRYIILDDDPSLFERGVSTPNLYLTSSKTGLTALDIERIIKRINH
ncbi:MAG: hypothetical protein J5829_00780 [Lachnospiraceae bacterium]|nr:hypothetical protein [Lachnospiraceae bacterium]